MKNLPEEQIQIKEPTSQGWITSITTVLFMPLTGLIPFLVTATSYRTLNPESWKQRDAISATMLLTTLLIFGIAIYISREYKINFKGHISGMIDLYEYENKKYIDYLMAHYGNVCSLAAILATIMFGVRSTISTLGITIPSIIASLAIALIFLLYGIIFLKTTVGTLNRKGTAIAALFVILILDTSMIKMAIKSIPKNETKPAIEKCIPCNQSEKTDNPTLTLGQSKPTPAK